MQMNVLRRRFLLPALLAVTAAAASVYGVGDTIDTCYAKSKVTAADIEIKEVERRNFQTTQQEPAVVSNVVARQRWPWNGLVDVDYEIGGDAAGLKVEIAFDELGDLNRHWVATNFLAGAEPTLNRGRNRATWDTKKDGVTNVVAEAVQTTVKLVREK